MRKEVLYIIAAGKRLFSDILGIKEGADIEATIAGIKRDISFRGAPAWILMFSIFIASIGLNVNSIAVIIGAMLISPLMGPILGIGLSIGTNDIDTLFKSFKNLAIAVFISLLTSTVYFLITPLNIEQTEILARTKPTILDVLVALFGGFAGIVAGSRKEKSNVVPGVAIATALMPPLCTAGYGLATFNMEYFFGAFYLFFINSVFISISTFLVVKYLKFPLVTYIEELRLKKYKRYAAVLLILTVIPSGVIFFNVIQETRFTIAAEKFIEERTKFEGSELINTRIDYSDTLSVINLFYIGEPIDEDKIIYMQDVLDLYGISGNETFPLTDRTIIKIHQGSGSDKDIERRFAEFNSDFKLKILEDIYTKNEKVIQDKDMKIKLLEEEIMKIKQYDTIPFKQFDKELKFHFDRIKNYSYAKAIEFRKIDDTTYVYDTIPTFIITFKDETKEKDKKMTLEYAQDWLRIRFDNDSLRLLENKLSAIK
jgi:uncharacterized hydrophobic protein (TIGR00271 family)